ncbi:MAG: phage holin family protein [Devosia sp.]
MALNDSARPLSDLVGNLFGDISGLLRKEIQLAKAEASEKLEDAIKASRNLAIGAVLAIGAIGVFLAALVSGLTALLIAIGMSAQPANFIAAMIVTAVVAAIAWSMLSRGIADLKANKLNMDRTVHSIRMDADAIRENV